MRRTDRSKKIVCFLFSLNPIKVKLDQTQKKYYTQKFDTKVIY